MQAKVDSNPPQPSVTALSVAWGFTRALDTEFRYLFSKQELQISKHLCLVGNQSLSGLTWALCTGLLSLPYSIQQSFFNRTIVPAHDHVVMLRKLMIKSKIEEAIQNGVKQIVFLGGGYDIRALMTAIKYPVKVYELDRGATRECKLRGLQSIPQEFGLGKLEIKQDDDGTVTINDKLYYIECDFIKDDLQTKLRSNHFTKEEKKLVIAEGLTAYLNVEDNLNLLETLQGLMNPQDELLISYITDGKKSQFFDASLRSAGETHKLTLAPTEVIAFVEKKGFAISHQFDATRLLNDIGDTEDANVYASNQLQLREYYVCLHQGSVTNRDINQIPFYNVPIPKNAELDSSKEYSPAWKI